MREVRLGTKIRDIVRSCIRAIALASLVATTACDVKYTVCSVPSDCREGYLTASGIEHIDPETGTRTKGPTITQLRDSDEYLYPVKFNPSRAMTIPNAEAIAFLQNAAAAADRPYGVCGFAGEGAIIQGVGAVPYGDLKIIPAHGQILNEDNYVIFVEYRTVSCVAYRRVRDPSANAGDIPQEMEWVTDALLRLGAKLEE